MHQYSATVVSIHDADTLTLSISMGFNTYRTQIVRLAGCNARELSEPGGIEARDHLSGMLPVGTTVVVDTIKPDKYGDRYLAAVTLPDGRDLVTVLATAGWVALWDGHGPRPVPDWPINSTTT